jgi:hypothetical protein
LAIQTLLSRRSQLAILGTDASPATLGATYAAGGTSDAIDANGLEFVTFWIYVDAKSTAAELYAQVLTSPSGDTATATDWSVLRGETYSSGTATLDPYEAKDVGIASVATDPTLVFELTIETRGRSFFQVRLRADAGTPTAHVVASGGV